MNATEGLILAIQQRVLPAYRVEFFDLLQEMTGMHVHLYAGVPREGESLGRQATPQQAVFYKGNNRYWGISRFGLYQQIDLLGWLENTNPDVLICEANPRNLSVPGALRWMQRKNKPVIGWGLGAAPARMPLVRWIRSKRLKQYDALLTYSTNGKQEYIQAGGEEQSIFVAPNAVTRRPLHDLPEKPALQSGEAVKILFVGRLQARKKVDYLIQACAQMPEPLRPVLTIVGDGVERMHLEEVAKQYFPQTRFTGELSGEPLDIEFDQADLFVMPGTGGLALQQALAHGLPVITGISDGTQTDLVRAGNGWILKGESLDELSATLQTALEEPGNLREMGKRGFQIVKNEVNLEGMVSAFQRAIDYSLRQRR